jgi:protoporphyrinogen oxidase
MKIGIIGAGFTGLSAAYYLQKKGHLVTIFEKDANPGGLAIGYKEKNWSWTLEQHYHHWFTNDKSVLNLAKEINHNVIIKRPKTSSFVDGNIYQLDSPLSLLKFPKISFTTRLRMGLSLALLKYNPVWKPLEKFRAEPYLKRMMGEQGYQKLWEPLMVNKLGKYASLVSLAWFWARIYKRTPSLGYPEGGFLNFAKHLQNEIEKEGGKFNYDTEVVDLSSNGKPLIKYKKTGNVKLETGNFDAVVVTLPSPFFVRITPQLPQEYKDKLTKLKGIGAINLVLRMSQPFFHDGTYWLSMCDLKSPILAIVEHTNFMDKKNYDGEHLLYICNYMETSDPRFSMDPKQLLKLYDPWLKKINPNYKLSTLNFELFRAPFAQPIIPPNYSKDIPPFKTPLKNVFLANIQQVYPWDRGTNYAVELGKKIAEIINDAN